MISSKSQDWLVKDLVESIWPGTGTKAILLTNIYLCALFSFLLHVNSSMTGYTPAFNQKLDSQSLLPRGDRNKFSALNSASTTSILLYCSFLSCLFYTVVLKQCVLFTFLSPSSAPALPLHIALITFLLLTVLQIFPPTNTALPKPCPTLGHHHSIVCIYIYWLISSHSLHPPSL